MPSQFKSHKKRSSAIGKYKEGTKVEEVSHHHEP